MENKPVRILLADYQALVRSGVRRLLGDCASYDVVAEASNGEETVELAVSMKPDVILMDIYIPGIGGMKAVRKIRSLCPDVKIIIVSAEVDAPFPAHLLDAGASGYLTKNCNVEEIMDAIEVVCQGERYISAEIARQMALSMMPGGKDSMFDCLSQREMQILLLVAQGRNTHDISDQLSLSSKTVFTYRYRLYEKLGVDNDVALVRLAMRYGVVGSPHFYH